MRFTLPNDGLFRVVGPVLGPGNAAKRAVAVIVCYLDDSGEKREPVICLAGYISLLPSWELFEREARPVLDDEGISHLHTVDFHHGRNEFKDWTREKRADFANRLFGVLGKHAGLGAECSLLKKAYQARRAKLGINKSISPIGGCFQILLDRIVKDERIKDVLGEPGMDLSFVVELGNKNNTDILNRFEAVQKHPFGRRLKSLSFARKQDFIALQVADFLAFYCRRIRVRGTGATRAKDESDFFLSVTEGIRHIHFLAADFGVDW